MTRYFRNRRVLGWSLFALLLAGTGWALDTWLPPEPRWIDVGYCYDAAFSADGRQVLTVSWAPNTLDDPCGPVQVRDAATGRTMLRFASDLRQLSFHETSVDFRRWIGVGHRAGDARPHLFC